MRDAEGTSERSDPAKRTAASDAGAAAVSGSRGGGRVVSIDALRGLVVFTMIFVNDLAGVSPAIVPAWMRHFPANGNGMTFVDLVFPAFLFVVGMSIPFALGPRLAREGSVGPAIRHVVVRTLSLLWIGILMVQGPPDRARLGWSPALWTVLMFGAAMLAFSTISKRPAAGSAAAEGGGRKLAGWVRGLGFAALIGLTLAYRGEGGEPIVGWAPFSVRTRWYGILGLIGWAYLVGSVVFLAFRGRRTALLGCHALLLCLFVADRHGAFEGFWLAGKVGIGSTLGSQASITVAGILLASALVSPGALTGAALARFLGWFVAGEAAAALLLHGLYGINKNAATPSWCLWAGAITAGVWGLCHAAAGRSPPGPVVRTLALAGGNVLLAYLLSEMFPSLRSLLGAEQLWDRLAAPGLGFAVVRSAGCAAGILWVATQINRLGFRLRL